MISFTLHNIATTTCQSKFDHSLAHFNNNTRGLNVACAKQLYRYAREVNLNSPVRRLWAAQWLTFASGV